MSHMTTDLWRLGARELADAIRSGRASSREVVEAHLERIEAVNPSVNAVTVVLAEQAVEAAEAADRAQASGAELPPLHGVPFTVKENIDLAGTPTTSGLRAFAELYPRSDAPVVERMRAAGGIPLGHSNCPDVTARWHTDSELFGATLNPWDPARTPGASSGGEAVALATGMTPLGLGNDGLGSLRWPAQCCGIASLKPTLGRIPHASSLEPGEGPISRQLVDVEGPMTRRVADLRAAFEVLAGPTWRDPWSVPVPLEGPRLPPPIRVAVVLDPGGRGTADQVQEGVARAGRILEEAGYAVEEIEPPSVETAARTLLDLLNPDMQIMWQFLSPFARDCTRQFLLALFEVAGKPDPMTTFQSFMTRQSLMREWGEFQEVRPLVVAPIFTDLPFEVGKDLAAAEVGSIVRGMRMTLAVNALGLPAVALPVGIGEGLPQAVQVIGPRYREDLCLAAAQALEDRLGIITPIDPRGEVGR
jgi:amidase